MKIKPLPSQERLQELFDYDPHTGVLRHKIDRSHNARVGMIAGTICNRGYMQVWVDRRRYLAHRIIFKWVTGRDPSCDVDHADCNTLNNAWSNLREASRYENRLNTRCYGSIPFKGVGKNGKKFMARIYIDRKAKYIGQYNTAEEAHEAWAKAYREHHGSEFARTK